MKVQKTPNNQYIITIPKSIAQAMDIEKGTDIEFKIISARELLMKKK